MATKVVELISVITRLGTFPCTFLTQRQVTQTHYGINDTKDEDPGCRHKFPLNSNTVPRLVFNPDFLQKATFVGTDFVWRLL